jgi:hypothetical protein
LRSTAAQNFEAAKPIIFFEHTEQTMSICVTCNEAQPRSVLSNVATTAVAVVTAMTFAASGAAPTSLYRQYQESFGSRRRRSPSSSPLMS